MKVLKQYIERRKISIKLKNMKNIKEKIILLQTPEHGNLGDQLIAIALREYLEKRYSKENIFELSYKKSRYCMDILENNINEQDIIFFTGGGNFGDLYVGEEQFRRAIISKFRKNKIVIMPQTISFTESANGRKELEETKRIYKLHNNLTIICREKKSFDFAKENFIKNRIELCPDSVFYLEDKYINNSNEKSREKVTICLREDKEKIMNENMKIFLLNYFKNNKILCEITDTVVDKSIYKYRKEEVLKLVEKFLESKLIITDRLHGMILAFITNTPVIVFKSLDHKIEESYFWLKDYKYVRYLEHGISEKELKKHIEEMMKEKVKKDEYYLRNKVKYCLDRI